MEINAFFPIKERTNAFETIEVIAKDIWSRNLMPCNLLPFAMDSGVLLSNLHKIESV